VKERQEPGREGARWLKEGLREGKLWGKGQEKKILFPCCHW